MRLHRIDTGRSRPDHCGSEAMRRLALKRPPYVPACRMTRRTTKSCRWLLLVVIGVLALLASDRAVAATVKASHGFDAVAHRHDCRCDTCRGEACCCRRDRSDPRSES